MQSSSPHTRSQGPVTNTSTLEESQPQAESSPGSHSTHTSNHQLSETPITSRHQSSSESEQSNASSVNPFIDNLQFVLHHNMADTKIPSAAIADIHQAVQNINPTTSFTHT
jgi:hypothetical protein